MLRATYSCAHARWMEGVQLQVNDIKDYQDCSRGSRLHVFLFYQNVELQAQ
jgi:hypothetical protein